MPSGLQYQSVFEENIDQTTDIKLAGETNTAPAVADATIELSVSIAELNAALTWTGNYVNADRTLAREEQFPLVTFNLTGLWAAADSNASVSTRFSSVEHDKLEGNNDGVDTLQGQFKKIVSAFNGISSWTPANIPLEAVVKVVNNAMTGNTLTQTLVSPAASSVAGSNPVNLYEQAVAADKTKDGGADFVADDSISVYIKYTLAKTRSYTLDDLDGANASYLIAGMTVEEDMESATVEKTYEVKFVAAA